jgi:hypothetical protein
MGNRKHGKETPSQVYSDCWGESRCKKERIFMWSLQMNMQCSGRFLEVLPDEVESAELSIENGVSHILMALFDEVLMEEVRVCFSRDPRMDLPCYIVQIGAECDRQYSSSPFSTWEHIKRAIAQDVAALLKELFGIVDVEAITMQPSLND